jgi:hypothetical protein
MLKSEVSNSPVWARILATRAKAGKTVETLILNFLTSKSKLITKDKKLGMQSTE